jgi:hypothetical protein
MEECLGVLSTEETGFLVSVLTYLVLAYSLSLSLSLSLSVRTHTHTHTYIHTYIHIVYWNSSHVGDKSSMTPRGRVESVVFLPSEGLGEASRWYT